jgi:hypothetical protein
MGSKEFAIVIMAAGKEWRKACCRQAFQFNCLNKAFLL